MLCINKNSHGDCLYCMAYFAQNLYIEPQCISLKRRKLGVDFYTDQDGNGITCDFNDTGLKRIRNWFSIMHMDSNFIFDKTNEIGVIR